MTDATDEDCPFCAIVAGEAPASVVYEDDTAVAFLDIRPANPGHTLVVPRMHADRLAELSEAAGEHAFGVGMRVAAALRGSPDVRTDGVNFFLADGEAAGQEVFHVHLHVVPRIEGDAVVLSTEASEADREELDELAAGLATQL